MSRKKARDVSMRLLFARSIGGQDDYPEILALMEEMRDSDLNDDDSAYIDRVTVGVEEKSDELDKWINRFAVRWNTERMSKVDLTILRLALYEILYDPSIPASVSINEAVALSHTYSTEEAGPFINGILGQCARAVSLGIKDPDTLAADQQHSEKE
ncbi:MAG: transcription antitermination factor NusB [Clostridia bacterium]|nr:transcription antitermination factor NusB [Clostridia bacterium]